VKIVETEIILFKGGDGSNVTGAIEIIGAKSFSAGVTAMFDYFDHVCGLKDILFVETEVMCYWDKTIHKISVCTKKGWSNNYFFDATDFQNNINSEDVDTLKTLFNTAN